MLANRAHHLFIVPRGAKTPPTYHMRFNCQRGYIAGQT
ncbi:MAG: hypothetical protein OJF49_004176 [Ktedonobacterales bacterium]|nr:MAG: hypothetical protein OJF49_004176 [Ktedonobacterales bacterium]